MKTVCSPNQCIGCMLCADSCPKAAITVTDGLDCFNAEIDPSLCVSCGRCYQHCQLLHPPKLSEPLRWAQGWATDAEIRSRSSSGGAAAAISRAFIENGGVVCSCVFQDGEFCFAVAETSEETERFAGSKYVKSNPAGVYRRIQALLKQGKRVLFLGLPCQVGALKALVGDPDDLYTADLICHGTPSPLLLERFLSQYGRSLKDAHRVSFRVKEKKQLHLDGKGMVTAGVSDRYILGFLDGLTFPEGCYTCHYAGARRVSDITLGDAYGSDLPRQEQKKGISLILCQTKKGKTLLEQADLSLFPVDAEAAIARNHQLRQPTAAHPKRSCFFLRLREGMSFNRLVFLALPKQCMKQTAKELLIRLRLTH